MARAALKLGVRELAERAQVSPNTVTRAESDQPSNASTLAAIKRALEDAGAVFIGDDIVGTQLVTTNYDSLMEAAVFKAFEQDPEVRSVARAPIIGRYRPDALAFFTDGSVGIVEIKGHHADARNVTEQLLKYADALKVPDARLIAVLSDHARRDGADPRVEVYRLDQGRLIPA